VKLETKKAEKIEKKITKLVNTSKKLTEQQKIQVKREAQ